MTVEVKAKEYLAVQDEAEEAQEHLEAVAEDKMKDKVSIIVPTWNKLEFLKPMVESIENNTQWPFELIIVDNASDDGTQEFVLTSNFKMDGQYIRNEENKGFAIPNNQGAKVAKGNFLCLLNNDTIVTKGWLTAMMKVFSEEKSVGLVGARLIHPGKGTIQHAGIIEYKSGVPDHIYFNKPMNYPPAMKRKQYFAVTGACMVTPKSLFKEVGGLDERYWCVNKDRLIVIKDKQDKISIMKISDFYDSINGNVIKENVKIPTEKWFTLVPCSNTKDIKFLKYILTERQLEIYRKRILQRKKWKVINKELGLNQSAHKTMSNGFNKNKNLFPGKWAEIKFIKRSKTKDNQILISDKFGQIKVTENHLISCIDGDKKAKFFNEPNKQKVIVTIPRNKAINGSIDEAVIVGAYCSEGSICKKNSNQISIASYNKKWLDMVSRSIKRKFPNVVPKYRKYKKKIVGIRINNNKSILPFLKKCGIGCENKKIPNKFFNSDKKTIRKLIKTLVQGDGHIIKRKVKDTIMYTSKSTELVAGISLLLKILSIQHSIYFDENKRVFNIKTIQSFSTKRTAGIKKEYSVNKDEYVYDLGIKTEHCFADALGLKVIHNCGWEDMDYCQKVRQSGMNIYYEPKSLVYHYESRTDGRYIKEGSNFSLYMNEWVLGKQK